MTPKEIGSSMKSVGEVRFAELISSACFQSSVDVNVNKIVNVRVSSKVHVSTDPFDFVRSPYSD